MMVMNQQISSDTLFLCVIAQDLLIHWKTEVDSMNVFLFRAGYEHGTYVYAYIV
jgi:hypothetical protein